MAVDVKVKVLENKEVAKGIFRLVMKSPEMPKIKGGQFLQLKVPDNSFILRRPLCIADYDYANNTITVVYNVRGKGTKRISEVSVGEELQVLFPLGGGFDIKPEQKKVLLVGGGTGTMIFPAVIRDYPDKEFYLYCGYSTKDVIATDESFKKIKAYEVATDDGSQGYKGFITDKITEDLDRIKPDVVLSCGPEPLYRTMKNHTFKDKRIPVNVSLEGRMCCGIGACYVCACKINKGDKTYTMRVCKDGTVFNLFEVEL